MGGNEIKVREFEVLEFDVKGAKINIVVSDFS